MSRAISITIHKSKFPVVPIPAIKWPRSFSIAGVYVYGKISLEIFNLNGARRYEAVRGARKGSNVVDTIFETSSRG